MRTAVEFFGEEWRAVDVVWLDAPEKRRLVADLFRHAETLTFGMACNALIRSLCRVDDVPRRHYAAHRQRFAPLRSGMFTLYDMALATTEWRCGKRWIGGYGPACDAVMGQFFGEAEVEEPVEQPLPAGKLRELLIEISRVGSNATIPMLYHSPYSVDQYRQMIKAMAAYAQAGIEMLDAARR